MNFVFISPNFPEIYWQWCDRLQRNGVNVLGVGDTPYDQLLPELKRSVTEYYYVPSLEDYDQVFRAIAFLSFKHGKIDWIESNNEYWLDLDAKLRDDFNVKTGVGYDTMKVWQSKAGMKPLYAKAGVPTARQARATSLEEARAFAAEVGWPLFAKPEKGMGAGGAFKIETDEELEEVFADGFDVPYVLEDFIEGELCSYDAIIDSHGDPVFENQSEFQPSIAEVVEKNLDTYYHSRPTVDPKLAKLGRATVKSFGITSRWVHMEFFRLTEAKPGLGEAGDYVGLEVNCRVPGGHTPEIINYAHQTDVYQIYADMVVYDERRYPNGVDAYGVHVGRRDGIEYVHSHMDIMEHWGDKIMSVSRIPDALSDDLGNIAYVARLFSTDEMQDYIDYLTERAEQ